jgi:hypothetical protein
VVGGGCTTAFHPAGFKLPNGTSYPGNPDLAWPVEIQQIARKVLEPNGLVAWTASDCTVLVSNLRNNCVEQAYYTAITQTDAQVGRVLDELDSLGYEQSTIVVICADRERSSYFLLAHASH